jgi:hypothetical protein
MEDGNIAGKCGYYCLAVSADKSGISERYIEQPLVVTNPTAFSKEGSVITSSVSGFLRGDVL